MAGSAGIFRGLDTVLLRVRDVDRARAWYQEKLGFGEPYFDAGERLAVFDLGGSTSLTLWELKPGERLADGDQPRQFPIFSVEDARTAWGLLRGRGVSVNGVVEGGGVTYFTFQDPDGNHLEACQVH